MVISNMTRAGLSISALFLVSVVGGPAAMFLASAAYYRTIERGHGPTIGRLLGGVPVVFGLFGPFAIALATQGGSSCLHGHR